MTGRTLERHNKALGPEVSKTMGKYTEQISRKTKKTAKGDEVQVGISLPPWIKAYPDIMDKASAAMRSAMSGLSMKGVPPRFIENLTTMLLDVYLQGFTDRATPMTNSPVEESAKRAGMQFWDNGRHSVTGIEVQAVRIFARLHASNPTAKTDVEKAIVGYLMGISGETEDVLAEQLGLAKVVEAENGRGPLSVELGSPPPKGLVE